MSVQKQTKTTIPNVNNNDVLTLVDSKLDNLVSIMEEKLSGIMNTLVKIESRLSAVETSQHEIEKREIVCSSGIANRVTALEKDSEITKNRVDTLYKYLPIVQILSWAAPIIGTAILAAVIYGILWAISQSGVLLK